MNQLNVKKIIQAVKSEAVYFSCETLQRYAIGFEAENGCVVIDKTGATLYTDKRYIEAAEKLLRGDAKATLYSKDEVMKRLSSYQSVGISFGETLHTEYLALEKEGVTLVDIDESLEKVMAQKSEWELANIQTACEIAEESYLALLPQIKEGMTETEVAALLEYEMRKRGAQGLSFATIVAFGAHAAVPHHETGDTKLQYGDEILIDFGCKVNGYCSDITRTCLFGDDGKHEAFKKAYQAVLTAHNLVQQQLVSGMTGKQADAIAREYLQSQGYGEYFTHSLGHGIGLKVHEYPGVSPRSETILQDGMVFSDEPGVYVAGEYGIRIEDTITLKDGKVFSFMKKTDKNLIIL